MRKIQAALRWLFLRVEGLFDAAFGDRMNPLYHLGSLTFYLFWVVAASGLYLYAFFETGVDAAHDSVEAITHGQWFAGGILRSLHRYASDALVVTMLLHLLRHFAFERFNGYRWFSWITGLVLIWGVYASGINGYMLPWDRLAQFVITTSFEWLEWLPSFQGTLMRNFIYSTSVSDRFFSLLSFLHIGLPLVVLLLMWVHVQRVPRARTTPPRPIAIGSVAALLLLSLLVPVLSQGGAADLSTAVAEVKLDWFYLALLPWMADGAHAQVWVLTVAATLLMAALPWLLRPAGGRQADHAMVVLDAGGSSAQVMVRAGETLLDAGLREGLALPYECRNGACGLCLCTVEQGSVDHRPSQKSALSDAMKAQGKALMCCATAREDLCIQVERAVEGAKPLSARRGRVLQMERLAPDVMRVWIDPQGGPVSFAAGQYINIVLEDGGRRAFSFANPPHRNDRIELHVRLVPGGRFTTHVFETMKAGDMLDFEGPLGQFQLKESDRPLLFVAGATGFAPVKSIVEEAFYQGLHRPMHLYWGVRRPQDLYLLDQALQWQAEHPDFHVIPVVSEPQPGDGWTGRTGLVHQALLADFPDLGSHEVYVCGSVRMVDTAVQAFLERGLDEQACFSDAFAPAVQPV